jgi:hypothetical protein
MKKKGKDQRYCKRCNRLTASSIRMKVEWITFHVCLSCGSPYEYRSYSAMVKVLKRPRITKVKGVTKYGKAGFSPDTYKLYLHTNHWKDKRASKLKLNSMCQNCMKEKAIDVHHLRYRDD